MDDDDEFLYGPSTTSTTNSAPPAPQASTSAPHPILLENAQTASANGVVAALEEQAEDPEREPEPEPENATQTHEPEDQGVNGDQPEYDEEAEEEEESDDEDIEFIMAPPSRTLDLRPTRPTATRTGSGAPPKVQPSLTTEYNPLSRGAPAPSATSAGSQPTVPSTPQQAPSTSSQQTPGLTTPQQPLLQQTPSQSQSQPTGDSQQQEQQDDDGVDTSMLPPVKAPPSHPSIDPSETGIYDGRPILEVDLDALADKPWRRPGSDISDWFNYGFDEISWEAYCYRRRDLGELAHVLKTNIINFSGMGEEQLPVLPPEVRTMVMTGANVAMNNAAQGMMGPGMMMDMSGMVGPMGMDMGMGPGMMPGMMQDTSQQQVGMMQGGNPGDQQVGNVGMMQDGFAAAGNPAGMMNMGMNEYGMQEQNPMVQQMYPGMDVSQSVQGGAGRGGMPYRAPGRTASGAAVPGGVSARGRGGGGFPARGRGGRIYDAAGHQPAPVRPASPLPPGVPTGPRNQNKYKDRDNNAPAVDGLDYGGGKDGGDRGRRTPSGEPEERSSSRYGHDRKRRSSPGMDDTRSSKRR